MYRVQVAKVADLGQVPGPEIFWMDRFAMFYPLQIHVVLLQGGGHNILVNCGPPDAEIPQMNAIWRQELGAQTRLTTTEPQAIKAVLAAWQLRPEQIDTIVLTPLQAYAVGGIDLFPTATICVSRTGWVDLLAPRHYDARRSMAVPDRLLQYLLFTAWPAQRVRLLDDEETLYPGLRTWWAGTHHRSSLVVEADTSAGCIAVSDIAFYYENLERLHWLGIAESLEECKDAYARLHRTAQRFVSLYDPATFERFPQGIVSGESDTGQGGQNGWKL